MARKRRVEIVKVTAFSQDGIPHEVDGKKCSKCNIVKPFSEFDRHKNCIGGYSSSCKTCRGKKLLYSRVEIEMIDGEEHKRCTGCLQILSLRNFSKGHQC